MTGFRPEGAIDPTEVYEKELRRAVRHSGAFSLQTIARHSPKQANECRKTAASPIQQRLFSGAWVGKYFDAISSIEVELKALPASFWITSRGLRSIQTGKLFLHWSSPVSNNSGLEFWYFEADPQSETKERGEPPSWAAIRQAFNQICPNGFGESHLTWKQVQREISRIVNGQASGKPSVTTIQRAIGRNK